MIAIYWNRDTAFFLNEHNKFMNYIAWNSFLVLLIPYFTSVLNSAILRFSIEHEKIKSRMPTFNASLM